MKYGVGEELQGRLCLCMACNAWARRQAKRPAGAYGPSETQISKKYARLKNVRMQHMLHNCVASTTEQFTKKKRFDVKVHSEKTDPRYTEQHHTS